jgi:hypothetical protein
MNFDGSVSGSRSLVQRLGEPVARGFVLMVHEPSDAFLDARGSDESPACWSANVASILRARGTAESPTPFGKTYRA